MSSSYCINLMYPYCNRSPLKQPVVIDISARIRHHLAHFCIRRNIVANTKSAKKKARQAEKHRKHNASMRSMLRTFLKKVQKAIETKDKKSAQTAYGEMQQVVDRYADK